MDEVGATVVVGADVVVELGTSEVESGLVVDVLTGRWVDVVSEPSNSGGTPERAGSSGRSWVVTSSMSAPSAEVPLADDVQAEAISAVAAHTAASAMRRRRYMGCRSTVRLIAEPILRPPCSTSTEAEPSSVDTLTSDRPARGGTTDDHDSNQHQLSR